MSHKRHSSHVFARINVFGYVQILQVSFQYTQGAYTMVPAGLCWLYLPFYPSS